MNEKLFIIFFISIFVFSACCTRRGLYYNGEGVSEVRNHFEQLGDAETATAIRSEKLDGEINQSLEGIRRSIEDVHRLEESIEDGEGDIEEFKEILRRIRAESDKGNKRNNSRKSFIAIKNRKAKEAYFDANWYCDFSYFRNCRTYDFEN